MRRESEIAKRMLAGLSRSVGTLLLSAATALAVVSCGGSDDVDAPEPPQPGGDTPIAFSGSLSEGKSETRAAAGLETVLPAGAKTFYVWSVKNNGYTTETATYTDPETVMWNYTVRWAESSAHTTTSNTNGWEYVNQQTGEVEQSIKFWDYSARAYRFFGYAAGGSAATVTVSPTAPSSSTAAVSLSFAVPDADGASGSSGTLTNPQSEPVELPSCPYYSTLWFSTGSLPDYPDKQFGKPVVLEFLKPYVKVRFLFKQSAPSDVHFYKKDISFAPTNTARKIATAGTFTVTYPLTGTATEESWSVAATSTVDALTQADDEATGTPVLDDGKWWVVLPATGQGTYTLSLTMNSEARTVVVPAAFMEWRPGYAYTYVFKITDAGGVALDGVEVGFSPWTTIVKDRDIYNW